jgi:murein DD-endopeptidase MepM/ murein hydrolase activator NlpD
MARGFAGRAGAGRAAFDPNSENSVQLILVDRRLSRARTLNVSRMTLGWAVLGFITLVAAAVAGAYALTFRLAAQRDMPLVKNLVSIVMHDRLAQNEQYLRDNVSSMAKMVGEMQARLMRLDALGERVSKLAGIRPEEFNFREIPGMGGAAPSASRPLTLVELQTQAQRVGKQVDERTDFMNVIESELVSSEARSALLPRNTPVVDGFIGSGFGMRPDPFSGELTMHAGIDFAAPVGTPIYAAAGGVVASAERHPEFGNAVTIDHGNGLSTLYAHSSRMLVKTGDFVRKGQEIAQVGTTGRSTGPHLHFEVHVNGVPQNPSKYLARAKPGSPLAGLAPSAVALAKSAPAPAAASVAKPAPAPAAVAVAKSAPAPAVDAAAASVTVPAADPAAESAPGPAADPAAPSAPR